MKGHYSLVYFGFTHCPDICPTSLLTIANSLNAMGVKGEDVVPVFISVDPERDTTDKLKLYVASFHPRMVGLTGSPAQVKKAADAYKVYFSKVETPDSALEYQIDHSGFIYLMDTHGEYITHFPHNVSEQTLTAALRERVK
jgi:protein SCO1/2